MNKKCALLTCKNLDGFVHDEHHLEKALQEQDWQYDWVQWHSEDVDWNQYQCALVRTTWDYIHYRELFLQKLKKIHQSQCQLLNPYSTICWNSDKIYLQDLKSKGLSTVPTLWRKIHSFNELEGVFDDLKCDKVVIKPRVGAGAHQTYVVEKFQDRNILASLLNSEVMIQPFMEEVVRQGEYSAHFFAEEFSHMILKKPKPGDFRSQEEFGSDIQAVAITSEQFNFCKQVLSCIKEKCLFARVDFVYGNLSGKETLMELELIEPSLYFRFKKESAKLLVQKLEEMVF